MRIISSCILLIFILHSCQNPSEENTKKSTLDVTPYENFPKLLDRHPSLYHDKEWETVQSTYGQVREEIIHGKNPYESKIKLAELFIQEARITGEHPHYYPLALAQFEEVINSKVENKDLIFRALLGKASVQLSLHDFNNAKTTAEEAVKINPYNAQIYGALVDANVELGLYDKAVEYSDKMISIRPDIRSYSRVSYLREIYGLVNESEESMKLAIQSGLPGSDERAWAMVTFADFLHQYNKDKEARNVLDRVLMERIDFPFAYGSLAEIEIDNKNYAKAKEYLDKGSEIIPEVGFYVSYAEIYKAENNTTHFKETIEKVLSMMKEDTDKGHNMDLEFAHLYANVLQDYDQALQYANKEYEKRPENIDVNRCIAMIYALKGDKEKAKQHLLKAARTGSKHPELKEIKNLIATI
ncbi:MAG: hypothetical protein M3Q56_10410 [Bacteroidota bacterium]|nr:hypothetical protein [Bacteroidota bacterium]